MNFKVYKSSAGSGKTFTLVKEYLKSVLLQPNDFRHLLAITFTNKAANEMKERIVLSLKELADTDTPTSSASIKFLLPTLIEETSLTEEELRKNANKALSLILHNYSDFAIGTIDSFVHKIIKTFAYDLHLPLNFEVELDAQKLLKQAIDLLISKVGSDQDLTDLLMSFTRSKIEEENDWNIENDLLRLSKALLNEDSDGKLDSLKKIDYKEYKILIKEINAYVKEYKSKINKLAKEAVELIESHQISLLSFYYGKMGIGNYFVRLSTPLNENFEANSRVLTTINDGKWTSGKISSEEKQSIETIKPQLEELYRSIENIKESDGKKYKLFKVLHKQIYAIAVLGEIEKITEEFKNSNNLIHISEFNKRIAEVVLSEPIPFIYERLGERYKSFFIDEFQDTSVLQWQNLLPLIDNSLSEGHFNMIVGDGKQAIYRWRSGEVEQFSCLPKIFNSNNLPLANEREETLIRNYDEAVLNKNYRSKKEIVSFNNDFFEITFKLLSDKLQGIYHNQAQEYNELNTGGYVSLQFVQKDKDQISDPILSETTQCIQRLAAAHYPYRDMSILCRTNRDASKIANHLMSLEIPVLSSESLLLMASPKLNLIIALLRNLIQNDDRVNQANILQLLIEIEFLNQSFDELWSEFISPLESCEEADLEELSFDHYLRKKGLNFNTEVLQSLPLYDLCEYWIRVLGFDKEVDPYIQFFLDVALKITIEGNSNLTDFLNWWDENKNKESVVIPEGLNAINIMTIHKSKGLEFPIVIFPYANESQKQTLDQLWVDIEEDELLPLKTALIPLSKNSLKDTVYEGLYNKENDKSFLDLMNLMYVAFTRASHQLYVIADVPPKKMDEVNSIPKILKFFLQNINEWDEELLHYKFGSFIECQNKEEPQTPFLSLESFNSIAWRAHLMMSTRAPEIWDVNDPERNKEWGNLIHFIFSRIEHTEQLPEAIDQLVIEGIIDEEKKMQFANYIKEVIELDEIKPYFKKGLDVRNEADIMLGNGQLIRPDRVIFEKDRTIIIDYKTGRPEQSHQVQIKKYGKVLHEMGYQNIQLILLYLNKKVKLVKVDL